MIELIIDQMGELRRLLTAEQEEVKRKEQELEVLRREKEKEVADLRLDIKEMEKAQASMELRLEEERKTAMEVEKFFLPWVIKWFFFKIGFLD